MTCRRSMQGTIAPMLCVAALAALAVTCAILVASAGEAPAVAAPADTADRFIVMAGGRNFRDVGGYRAQDGRVVRREVMYRSGSLGNLALDGQMTLRRLGVAAIVDLRTTEERSHDSSNFLAASGIDYWRRDYAISLGEMARIFSDPANLTPERISATMAQAYRTMPKEQAPAYRVLFARLLDAKGPVVVNCTAGKDRTGIASALVLTAIGVPYETVRQDFLLSNGAPGMETLASGSAAGALARMPKEMLRVLGGVDGAWLDAAFEGMRTDYGSVEGYLEAELGVGPAELSRLRVRMLR